MVTVMTMHPQIPLPYCHVEMEYYVKLGWAGSVFYLLVTPPSFTAIQFGQHKPSMSHGNAQALPLSFTFFFYDITFFFNQFHPLLSLTGLGLLFVTQKNQDNRAYFMLGFLKSLEANRDLLIFLGLFCVAKTLVV